MDFAIPTAISQDLDRLRDFIRTQIVPDLSTWTQKQKIPDTFFHLMGKSGWYGFKIKGGRLIRGSAFRVVVIAEEMAKVSPGVAVAALAHVDLGLMGLFLFGSQNLHQTYGASAVQGKTIMCLGNTENRAGSDVAGISMSADKVDGGWMLNGTKAYVTNGLIADLAVITAVSDPKAARNNRLSMYLVDLNTEGVHRKKLNKQVWIPSDLTRLRFNNVFVPDDHLGRILGNGIDLGPHAGHRCQVARGRHAVLERLVLGLLTPGHVAAKQHTHDESSSTHLYLLTGIARTAIPLFSSVELRRRPVARSLRRPGHPRHRRVR